MVPFLSQATAHDFKQKWLKNNIDLTQYQGSDALDKYYAKLKEKLNEIAGAQPVDDIYETLQYYIHSFKQVSSETVKEYVRHNTKRYHRD